MKNLAYSSDGKKLLYSAVSLTGSLQSLPLSVSGEPVGDPTALTSDVGCRPVLPVFSPDGSRIAFYSCRGRAGVAGQIWMMNHDGSGLQQLTFGSSPISSPSWFPDGSHILFSTGFLSPPPLRVRLFSLSVETRQQVQVAEAFQNFGVCQLSPDGKEAAFNSIAGGIVNLWLLDMATGKTRQLTFDKEMLGFPAWSPDGRFIAAEMRRGRDTNIVIIPSSGGAVTQLTFDRGENWSHSWSPDGSKVLFAKHEAGGFWNVWSVSRSTKAEKQLTRYSKLNAFVRYPAYSPRGNQIVYEYTESTGNIWMLEFK